MINLKDIAVETKQAEIELPGFDGFKVTVNLMTRPKIAKIREECMTIKYTKHGPTNELNQDKFADKFSAQAIAKWEGLTGAYIKKLMPVDESAISDDDTVPYSSENASLLLKNSEVFDSWLNDIVFELDNFRK